jgi:sugar O-acyltransferase (sialic acid O-acetyltransferase NeuD family)
MRTESCVILGAGGHAKVVIDALQRAEPASGVEVWDEDLSKSGATVLGFQVRAPIGGLLRRRCHVAIGENAARLRLGEAVVAAGGSLVSIIHPAAQVSTHAGIMEGAFIAAQAVVAPGARVGRGAIVNHGAIVDHDCEIGDWAHIAPGAILGGGVRVGTGCLVGSGAKLLPGVSVGEGATVGSGAVVLRDVRTNITVAGVPARSLHGKR